LILSMLTGIGFTDNAAARLVEIPNATAHRVECAIASAHLKGHESIEERVAYVHRFIDRNYALSDRIEKKARELREARAEGVPAAPAAPVNVQQAGSCCDRGSVCDGGDDLYASLRDWTESKTDEQLAALRDRVLSSTPPPDEFVRGILDKAPLRGRTAAYILMRFEVTR